MLRGILRMASPGSQEVEPKRRQGDAAAAFELGQSQGYRLVPCHLALHAVGFRCGEDAGRGFGAVGNRDVREELKRRVAKIDAMSEEERAEKLISAEKIFSDLKEKYGVKD